MGHHGTQCNKLLKIYIVHNIIEKATRLGESIIHVGNFGKLLYNIRYGLVVRISGSHPGGPGSIPGNGILFPMTWVKARYPSRATTWEKCLHPGLHTAQL